MTRAVEVLVIVLWIVVLVPQPAVGIVNKRRNISRPYPPHFYPRREYFKKQSYLKVDRPLWVLEDKVTRPGEVEIATHRPFQSKRRFISPAKLPNHYANLDSPIATPPKSGAQRTQSTKIFPVFDDFEAESEPILIYRGPKAEMIFNTMMTSRQYPMKEPVPGQVMYPPYSPKFKPTPVVERVRASSVFHNVTVIPFYAHEAIDPRQMQYEPAPVDGVNANNEVDNIQEESQNYLTDEEDREAACYHSYYSQDDVQSQYWTPQYTTTRPPEATTQMGLQRQVAIPNGIYSNHRMEATTAMPRPQEDPFRIMYDSREIENPPPKRYKSVHTAKYGGFKTIYPIYTLNKLLKYKPLKRAAQTPSRRSDDTAEGKRKSPLPPEETWLIWDSRHKAAHTSNYLNPMSSKRLSKHRPATAAALDTKILVQ